MRSRIGWASLAPTDSRQRNEACTDRAAIVPRRKGAAQVDG